MFRQTEVFPVSIFWKDRQLALALFICVAVLIASVVAGAYYVKRNTVLAQKIANVSLVTERGALNPNPAFRPISQISEAAKAGGTSVLAGYAANVRDVCRTMFSPTGEVILLSSQGSGYMAVRTELTNDNCNLFLESKDGSQVFVVADEPFYKVESHPAYVILNKPDGTQPAFLVR